MCGANTISELGRIERNILNSLAFKCQHYGCQAIVQYQNIRKHLSQECVHKIELPPEEIKIIEKQVPIVQKQQIQEEEEDIDHGYLFWDEEY